jgi:DNA anti-recombination protein RmuC
MGAFSKQWITFQSQMEKMGKRIEDAHKEYETLTTTRSKQLDKVLVKIDNLRSQKGITIAELEILPAVNNEKKEEGE